MPLQDKSSWQNGAVSTEQPFTERSVLPVQPFTERSVLETGLFRKGRQDSVAVPGDQLWYSYHCLPGVFLEKVSGMQLRLRTLTVGIMGIPEVRLKKTGSVFTEYLCF